MDGGDSDRKDPYRACDACRRMKIRCTGKENPPCHRCRGVGEDCTFLMKSNVRPSELDRVRALEAQLARVENALSEILQRNTSVATQIPSDGPASASLARRTADIQNSPIVEIGNPYQPQSPSRSKSDDDGESEGDPLDANAMQAPLRDMMHAVEASMAQPLHAVNQSPDNIPRSTQNKRPAVSPMELVPERLKHPRIEHQVGSEIRRLKHLLPFSKGGFSRLFMDPIDLEICSESTAKHLFDLFFSESHIYMPVFDATLDTLGSLRQRSPFCVTTILMVGQIVQDGGAGSELQQKLRTLAEDMAKDALFSDVASLEIVQGLILLASWGSMGWRPGNLVLSIAFDMGLQKCLDYLTLTGMGANKLAEDIEEDRLWVIGARLWLVLYKLKAEMALNNGSPVALESGDSLRNARAFLTHPLSTTLDSRVIAACELLKARLTLHDVGEPPVPTESERDMDEKIKAVNHRIDAWETYWGNYYNGQTHPGTYALKSLMTIQVDFSNLHANARVLWGLRKPADVARLSDDRLLFLYRALKAASHLVQDTVRSSHDKLQYANGYTHAAIAYTARCLLRLASLLPQAVDLRQLGKDIEELANRLATYPGLQWSEHLRQVVQKARRDHVLPPSSLATSPILWPTTALPMESADCDDLSQLANDPSSLCLDPLFDYGADQILGPSHEFQWAQGGWDFSLMDQLFSSVAEAQEPTTHFWDKNGH